MRASLSRRALVASLVCCAFALAVRAGDIAAPVPAPLIGRPENFSEAVGVFTVTAHAEPDTVQVEQPLLFTLRIQAELDKGPLQEPPQRFDLKKAPGFDERFFIEDPQKDTYNAATQTWEFLYRLKPRGKEVTEIPSVEYTYFNPAVGKDSKGYQVCPTDEIPLHVIDQTAIKSGPTPVPDLFLEMQSGPALLARAEPWSPPGWPLLTALVLAPPLVCAAWYASWRRLYPDAGRLLKQRRSRAANLALKRLEQLPGGAPEERAAHIAAAVTTYLQQRLDLPAAEPTPAEAAAHLNTAGCPDTLSKRAEQFFQSCDAGRFYPNATAVNLPESARQLILELEAHTWAAAHS